jgi:hypothetical protein
MRTSGGQKAFPELAQACGDAKAAQNIASAVVGALSELSERPRHQKPNSKVIAAGVEPAPISGERIQPVLTQGASVSQRAGTSNSAVKMPLVALIVSHVTGDQDKAQLAHSLGLSPAYVRKACSRPNVQARDGITSPGILDMKMLSSRDGTLTTHTLLQEAIVDFFHENTSVFSGATRKTRRLLQSRTELLQRFFALLPQMLRAKAAAHPELSRAGHLAKQYTALQANTLAALHAAEQKGFDEVREVEERLAAAKKHDMDKLVAKRLAALGIRTAPVQKPARAKLDRSVASFNASSYPVTPPTKETFWKVLEHRGVRFTEVSNPTQCPIHDSGPVDEAALAAAVAELTAVCKLPVTQANTRRRKALVTEQRALRKAVDLYRLHLRQYEKQRAKAQRLEADLVPGEGVLYRDFVNDHDETGAKVCNLQLVLVERKVLGGPLVLTNIENFADKESCDAWFTADVFDFHLAPGDEHHSGLLDHLTKLYVVGDHGPHFSANNTLLNESSFFSRYGKVVECVFLCSYHAYNRCDAAGVVPKRLAAHEKRQSKGPVGALAYAELVNASSYANHVAFSFPAINRSADVFPAEVEKLPHARQCCDVLYHHTRADGTAVREEGVVWFRMVSDLALPYQLHDLLPRVGKYMCAQCSNTAQEPVFHTQVSECPRTTMPVALQRAAVASPDAARMQGPQLASKRKGEHADQPKRAKRAKGANAAKVGAFPCKATFCTMLHYTTPGGANRHMAAFHADLALEDYPAEPMAKRTTATVAGTFADALSGDGAQALGPPRPCAESASTPALPTRAQSSVEAGRSLQDAVSSASESASDTSTDCDSAGEPETATSEAGDTASESSDREGGDGEQSEADILFASPPLAAPLDLASERERALEPPLSSNEVGPEPMSEYERQRQERIASNAAELARLGLGPGGPAMLPAQSAARRGPGRPSNGSASSLCRESAPARRSSRRPGLAFMQPGSMSNR